MGRVLTHMTMSLDGYIAGDDDQVGALFDWYSAGPLAVPSAAPGIEYHLDEAGAAVMRGLTSTIGALVTGRHLFDIAGGWGDRHPVGAPVVVVTHEPPGDAGRWPRTRFVSGVPAAVELAQQIAADRDVVIASADVAGQALDLGLIDEVAVSLAPLVLGGGKRYFGSVTTGPLVLEDPEVVSGLRATHLRYRVRR